LRAEVTAYLGLATEVRPQPRSAIHDCLTRSSAFLRSQALAA
jgi:hypothetical protein